MLDDNHYDRSDPVRTIRELFVSESGLAVRPSRSARKDAAALADGQVVALRFGIGMREAQAPQHSCPFRCLRRVPLHRSGKIIVQLIGRCLSKEEERFLVLLGWM